MISNMMITTLRITVLCLLLLQPLFTFSSQEKAKGSDVKSAAEGEGPLSLEKISLEGLAFRSIGPAVTGGRVIDIEVNPRDPSEYYVASGHGSLWKTTR